MLAAWTAYYSELLPIIFYLIFAKRNKGEGLWVIWLYCIITFSTENIFWFLHFFHAEAYKFYIYTSFSICELATLSYFFYSSLKNKILRYIPAAGTIIFTAVFIFYMIAAHQISRPTFDSLSASIEDILGILYCLLLLYEQIKDPTIVFVYNTKKFWIIIAFFLYFSSTLFLFLFANTLTIQEQNHYWIINNVFEILKNILLCISFIIKKGNKSYPLESFESPNPYI